MISIHALREEGDYAATSSTLVPATYFYPRPPRGGRPAKPGNGCITFEDFYPRPPRGGRRAYRTRFMGLCNISIHALREEGDPAALEDLSIAGVFLSTPSARRATTVGLCAILAIEFLSTPSARRATRGDSVGSVRRKDFYPRPPRGGRRHGLDARLCDRGISIHALREEGDRRT